MNEEQSYTPQEENPSSPIDATPAPQIKVLREGDPLEKVALPPKKEKVKKSHPFLKLVLACLCCLACGFGGGFLAIQLLGTSHSTVIYRDTTGATASATLTETNGLSVQEIANLAQPSVVEIKTETTTSSFMMQEYVAEGAGSGVILTSDGYIVTNNHVVEDAQTIYVNTSDGTSYEATLVGTDSKTDIAVVKIDATNLTPVLLGDSSKLSVGDACVAIGNPLGTLGGTVTNGIISALDREVTIGNESYNLLQTNAAVNPGNSGGGLFNSRGELIGIVNAKSSSSSGSSIEGIGFAIPVNDITDIVSELIEYGYVQDRATLGVQLTSLAYDQGNYTAGVYVTGIVSGSAAEAAGIHEYDKIVAVDGASITSYTELSKILKDHAVGDTITLTLERDGETLEVQATLTQASANSVLPTTEPDNSNHE